jgi:hypothetical protein
MTIGKRYTASCTQLILECKRLKVSVLQCERVKGIEPSCPAWEAGVLPLNYTRGRKVEGRGMKDDGEKVKRGLCAAIKEGRFPNRPFEAFGGL